MTPPANRHLNIGLMLIALLLFLIPVNVAAQTYNDGPIELQIRVTAVRVDYDTASQSNDYNLDGTFGGVIGGFVALPSLASDEITCKVWARDNMGSSWQGGICIIADLPMSTGGPEIFTVNPPVIMAFSYPGQQVPQFFDLKLEAWEDDISADFDQVPSSVPFVLANNCQTADGFSRCVYDGTSTGCINIFGANVLSEADDIYCNGDPFKTNLDYRAAGPPGQWNSHGFIGGNCPANNFYQLQVESYWRFTNVDTDAVSGKIISETGSPVQSATLKANGTGSAQTAATGINGAYSITLDSGFSYNVAPSKSNDLTTGNGISSLDILLMRKHILGTPLSSPYKIIAADVNSSGSVSTTDILLVRSMILQTVTTFPGHKLWTFVPHDFAFADSTNPFPHDTSRYYASVSSMSGQDFIGIKLGDVNNSWDPNIPKNESFAGKVELKMDCATASQAGEEITIPVRAKQFENVSGMQFTLGWNQDALTFQNVENGKLQADFATKKTNEGMLGVLWTDEQAEGNTLEDDEILFSLKFITNRVGEVCEVNITSTMIPVEAVNGDLELLELAEWKDESTSMDEDFSNGYKVYQNYPNPFSESTIVSFELPKKEKVTMEIYDLLGIKVQEITDTYDAGKQNVQLGDKLIQGVYYLRFRTDSYSHLVKILHL